MNYAKINNKYLAALLAVFMALAAFAVIADSSNASDASTTAIKDVTDDGFMDDKVGTLHIKVNCTEESDEITVTVIDNNNEILTKEFEVKNGETTLDVQFKLSEGGHDLSVKIVCKDKSEVYSAHHVDVKKSVWSNITTYLAIVALAIIVIIIAVVYMRANPRNKPTTTFTELEKQKNASQGEESAQSANKSTEKIKYESSRRK